MKFIKSFCIVKVVYVIFSQSLIAHRKSYKRTVHSNILQGNLIRDYYRAFCFAPVSHELYTKQFKGTKYFRGFIIQKEKISRMPASSPPPRPSTQIRFLTI